MFEPVGNTREDNHKSTTKPFNESGKNTNTIKKLPSRSEIIKQEQQNTSRGFKKPKLSTKRTIILIPVLLISVILFKNFFEEKTIVPEANPLITINSAVSNVCEIFENSDLSCTANFVYNEKPNGTLLSQSLQKDEMVALGSNVILTYSKGNETFILPDYNNIDITEVKKDLYDHGIKISKITEVSHTEILKNKIISTNLEPNTKLNNGDSIELTISNGSVVSPNLIGKNIEEGYTITKDLGVNINVKEEESEEAVGTILSQYPLPNETITSNDIDVIIATPFVDTELTVPDNIITKTDVEVHNILAEIGFRNISTVKVENNDVTTTQVTQVVPNPGATIRSNDLIVIIVSTPISN